MRPLTHNTVKMKAGHRSRHALRARALGLPHSALAALWLLGCGGGPASVSSPPPSAPPPPSITVTVTPMTGSVLLGNSQTLTATVTNTADTSVTWSVNNIPGGTPSMGTITSAGVYTAPTDLPSQAIVQVTATSQADSSKSATAQITITSDIGITIAPPNASIELGAVQSFHAAITSAGHPDTSVRWSLSGAACPTACGSVDLNGNYTAPGILPSATTAMLTAQSLADPSKQASAAISITSNFTLQVTAPQSVPVGGAATIVATMTPVAGSNPNMVLSWSLSGPGCSSTTCGTLTVVTTQGSGGSGIADTATYTAPTTPPSPDSVIVTVTPQADPTKKAQATMAVQAGVNVSLSPAHGNAGCEPPRDADRASLWNNKYRSELERQRHFRRKHIARTNLRCGLKPVPERRERERAASGLSRARNNSPTESSKRNGNKRGGRHEKRVSANHDHQSCAGFGVAAEHHAGASRGRGIHGHGPWHQQPKRGVASSRDGVRERRRLRRNRRKR